MPNDGFLHRNDAELQAKKASCGQIASNYHFLERLCAERTVDFRLNGELEKGWPAALRQSHDREINC